MASEEKRYIRLKAIREFGYDVDWDELQQKHLIIAGVGGIGSIAAEMLTRCGIGRLTLIDLDTVGEENLNRLFYRSEHIGQKKVEVAKVMLQSINPNIDITTYHTDICSPDFERAFENLLKESDLLLMGLDNLAARQYVNIECVEARKPYVDAGASRSGLSGYVHLIKPFETACYACIGYDPPLNKQEIVSGEPCTASLPTTIAIIAGLQVQQTLNYILNFGEFSYYLAYNALTSEVDKETFRRNPKCPVCGKKVQINIKDFVSNNEVEDSVKKLIQGEKDELN